MPKVHFKSAIMATAKSELPPSSKKSASTAIGDTLRTFCHISISLGSTCSNGIAAVPRSPTQCFSQLDLGLSQRWFLSMNWRSILTQQPTLTAAARWPIPLRHRVMVADQIAAVGYGVGRSGEVLDMSQACERCARHRTARCCIRLAPADEVLSTPSMTFTLRSNRDVLVSTTYGVAVNWPNCRDWTAAGMLKT